MLGYSGAWYIEECHYPDRKGLLLFEYDGIHLAEPSDRIRQELHNDPILVERSMKNAGGWSLSSDYWAGIWSGRMYIGDGVHDSFNPELRDYSEYSHQEHEQMIYGTQGQILQALFDSSKELLLHLERYLNEISGEDGRFEGNATIIGRICRIFPNPNHPIVNGAW